VSDLGESAREIDAIQKFERGREGVSEGKEARSAALRVR
jgi:hypothetical protein